MKDGWRLSRNGWQESGTSSGQTPSSGPTTPLKPTGGLSGPPWEPSPYLFVFICLSTLNLDFTYALAAVGRVAARICAILSSI